MIKGCDISHHNKINWQKMSPDFKFVFCKASQGATYHDPAFNGYWQHLKTTNLFRGAYHFVTATDSAQSQADNFLSLGVDWSKPNVLPPVIDVEDQVPASLNVNITKDKGAFIQLVTDWIDIIAKETGRTPIVYSYKNFFAEYLNSHAWTNPLWISAFQSAEPGLPKGYGKYTFWQYSQYGLQDGSAQHGDLDLDWFNGSIEELGAL